MNRASGKTWRRLGLVCVIAALALAPWWPWIAVALGGIGLGAFSLFWLGRSPWNLEKLLSNWLQSSGPSPLPRPTDAASPANESEKIEELRVHRRSAWRGPNQAPVARELQSPTTVSARPAYSVPATSFQVRTREVPAETTVRPQNCFRLAADMVTPEPGLEKPPSTVGSGEVIDLPSVMGNLERRYRTQRPTDRSPMPEQPSNQTPPDTMNFEEIRRRLLTSYGRRLNGGPRQTSPQSPGVGRSDADHGFHGGRIDASPARFGTPPRAPRGSETGAKSALRPHGHPCDPGGGPEVNDHPACMKPLGRLPAQNKESAVEPLRSWPASPFAAPSDPKATAINSGPPMAGATAGDPVHSAWRVKSDMVGADDELPQSAPFNPVIAPGLWPRLSGPYQAVAVASEVEASHIQPASGDPASIDAPPARLSRTNPPHAGAHEGSWLPPLSLLRPADTTVAPMTQDDLIDGGILIEEKLAEFRVKVSVQDAYAGPVITRYEVQPAVGVRGGQVVSLMKDLARALGVASIRVVETIPGKTCMGLELPNPRRQMIHLSEVLSSEVFQSHPSKLAMVLGKDITGEPVVADLARAPHMLVAGTTGSGKSVGVNAMILSLLYRATPDEVRFVMIDPKMLELSIYDGIPHLLAPVVTDMKLAANALTWCVGEMERRYRLMSVLRVRSLAGYNEKVREAADGGELLVDPLSLTQDNPTPLSPLPYVVVVVDELADLMMVAGKKIEELVARLAQKARAAGIHLIIATQRPSVDVITGLIKANIPTRIAFQVSSKIDSRTILDQMGAECLLGQGDMLYLPPGTGYPQRVHGAFVPDEDVYAVAEYLKQRGEPDYVEGVLSGMPDTEEGGVDTERFVEEADPLYDDAVAFVISSRRASISAVQRQLRIGYNRAARLVEQMEAAGLVSPMESNGNRTVLVPPRPE